MRSGSTLSASSLVRRGVEPQRGRRGLNAGGPDDRRRSQPPVAEDDAFGAAFRHRLPEHDFDAQPLQRALRIEGQVLGESGQHARTGLDQHDARLTRVDAAELGRQRGARQFGDRAGKLDPCRTSADNDEGQKRRPLLFVGLALGLFEGEEYAAANGRRVLERLEARRERLPIVMAEIGVPRAGRQHERVVAQRRAGIEVKLASLLVDGLDGSEQSRDIQTPAKEVADRPGDLGGRERRRRRLIEQRLKQMMVAAVDDGDPDRRASKPVDGLETAEPGADHDHMMSVRHFVRLTSQQQRLAHD